MSSTKTKLLDSAQKNLLKGQFVKAIAEYRQIIQLDPSDMRHRQKLAEILTKANLKDEAINEYTSLAKQYVDSVHYLKAIAVYKQIQKLEPTNPEISLTLGSLNEKQGLIGNATSEYASAIHIYENNGDNFKALKVLESMLALDPGNSAVRLRIAEKYFAIGKESNAFSEFVALATDLKSRNDENGFMHVSEKIHQLFKEKAHELFTLIEGDEKEEDFSLDAPVSSEPESEPEQIPSELLQAPSEKCKQLADLVEELPEPLSVPISTDVEEPYSISPALKMPAAPSVPISTDGEEPVEDISLIEELEEIEDIEEISESEDEPEWEEDIDLDLHETEQLSEDDFVHDLEEYEEPEQLIELDELELDDIELELELDDEELDTEPSIVQTDMPSQANTNLVDEPFDLAGELSIFADDINFDLIKTSSADPPFTLDTTSGFKRNELDNEDAESHYSLGLAYKEMGLFEEAISEFIVASRSDSRKIDALILQAVCFRELGETEKAVEILSDTLNFPEISDDELLGLKYELAICREALGEIQLARQLYSEIMTVRPDFSDTASRISAL